MHTLEVDLLCCFSSGGGGHPSARESTLLVRDVSEECVAMEIKIHSSYLAVLLKGKSWDDSELLVFHWRTIQDIAVSVIGIVSDLVF
jgi:hypothetical protein